MPTLRDAGRRVTWTAAAIALVAGVLLVRNDRPVQPASAIARNDVGSFPATQGRIVRSLLVTGELQPVNAVRITAPKTRERGSAPIQAMAPEGSLVKPGDLLLQIDSANLLAGLYAEKINLEKAANDRVKKEAEEEIRIKDLERQLAARKTEIAKAEVNAGLPKEFIGLWEWQNNQFALEKARKEYVTANRGLDLARKAAREEIDLVRIKHDQAQARIAAIEADLKAMQIVSDRSGTVLYENAPLTWNSGDAQRKFQVGDQVSSGMVIMTVPDLSEMEVRAFVSEVDGGRLRGGQRVRLTADSQPGKQFEGTVESVPEVAEQLRRQSNVRVFVSKIKLDRTDPTYMKPGMSVRAEIFLDEPAGVVVPRSSVRREGGKYYVERSAGGRSEVTIVARNAASFLVRGLNPKDAAELRQSQ